MAEKYTLEEVMELAKKGEKYSELEKSGRLLKLPCQLETMVYKVIPDCSKCKIVENPSKCTRKLHADCPKKVMPSLFTPDLINEYGKTVFGTESEALVIVAGNK
ncbi:MAG: hypothetical protein K6G01_07330 [Eubacterium sp.]|nr:hypothetical protein [Eubacterium sp.]